MALVEAISTIRYNRNHSGGTTSFEFTSIPSTYNHLQLACNMKGDNNADALSVGIQIGNSSVDTGSNYSIGYVAGQSATAEISNVMVAQASHRMYDMMYGLNTILYEFFGYMTVLIADYANTNKNTSMHLIGGGLGRSDSKIQIQNNTWDSTVAVTNIKVYPFSDGFLSGTEMTLYGIKDS
tara:strand:- start:991 stop:1533 length:543 start_codon:yes stop_codon:yes gene_type:complete